MQGSTALCQVLSYRYRLHFLKMQSIVKSKIVNIYRVACMYSTSIEDKLALPQGQVLQRTGCTTQIHYTSMAPYPDMHGCNCRDRALQLSSKAHSISTKGLMWSTSVFVNKSLAKGEYRHVKAKRPLPPVTSASERCDLQEGGNCGSHLQQPNTTQMTWSVMHTASAKQKTQSLCE